MKKLKQFWKFFEGKKRNIGILATFALKGLTIFAPNLLPPDQSEFIERGIDIFLMGGLFDNLRRTNKGKQIQKNITDKGKQMQNKVTNVTNNLIKIKK